MSKVGNVTGRAFHLAMFFLVATIAFGAAFIVTSRTSRFFKWEISDCKTAANVEGLTGTMILTLDPQVDIGWNEFTVTYLDPGTIGFESCVGGLALDETYPLADYQDNSASLAGLGMVASWGLGVLVALYTVVAMVRARHGQRRGGIPLTALAKWCALFTIGVVAATTVFWWLVEGKFGKRQESLSPRLFELVVEGAETCRSVSAADRCNTASWAMDAPGWSLSMGITAMFAYAAATVLLWLIAPRVDHLNSGSEELEMEDPAKPPVGGNVVVEKTPQPEEKARAKDRRSAKTGVRAGGRAPSSTVQGGQDADQGPDPMTYALEQGHDEELGSVDDDDEEEVVYQNHQVHHAVINHSQPNPTQGANDQASRQYSRGYSRGTSGASYVTGGGRSFDERSDGDYSETASSAYYAQGQGTGGRSFMSSSSRGESFDEYSHVQQ